MNLEMVSDRRKHPLEASVKVLSRLDIRNPVIKIEHQEPSQDSTCPLSLFLESWRTWRFLMNLEMVSDRREILLKLL